jgi:hypothetical protein
VEIRRTLTCPETALDGIDGAIRVLPLEFMLAVLQEELRNVACKGSYKGSAGQEAEERVAP